VIDPQVSASQVTMATTDTIMSVLRDHLQQITQ
jgi:hypothetical protein